MGISYKFLGKEWDMVEGEVETMGQIPLVMFCAGIGYLDETSVNEFFIE